jgi:predicted phosphoribosyltransferase
VRFADREAAGRALADRLALYAHRPDGIVLGLPRGGVLVAAPVATALGLPADVLVIRKLGLPWAPEVAFGAIGTDPRFDVCDDEAAEHIDPAVLTDLVARERDEAARREWAYRTGRPPLDLTGAVALIVDDGLATGATAMAAIGTARGLGAARVVIAAPVGAPDTCAFLAMHADEVVCAVQPRSFGAVSRWYGQFDEVTDDQVRAALI